MEDCGSQGWGAWTPPPGVTGSTDFELRRITIIHASQ